MYEYAVIALLNPWYVSLIAINTAQLEISGTTARLTLALTRFPDDGSADFCTLVTFQRITHFTFHRRNVHRRNGGAELSHSDLNYYVWYGWLYLYIKSVIPKFLLFAIFITTLSSFHLCNVRNLKVNWFLWTLCNQQRVFSQTYCLQKPLSY